MFFGVREILRSTAARHRGQRKIGISMRAGTSNREVARELEEDMEPGAEGDLNASAHGPCGCSRRLRPPQLPPSAALPVDDALSVARARLLATNRGRRPPLRVAASNPVPRSDAPRRFLLTAASSGGAFRRF